MSTLEIHNDIDNIVLNRYDRQVLHSPNSCRCQPPASIVEVPAGAPCDLFFITQDGFVHRYDIAHNADIARPALRDSAIANSKYRAIRDLFDGGLVELITHHQYPSGSDVYPLLKHCYSKKYEVYVSEDALVSEEYVSNYYFPRITGHIIIASGDPERPQTKVNSRLLAKFMNKQMELHSIDDGKYCIADGDDDTEITSSGSSSSTTDNETEPVIKKQRLW